MSDAAREMTPERLAEVRASLTGYGERDPDSSDVVALDLLAHVDALTARLDAERVDFHRVLGEVRRQERAEASNAARWLHRYEGEKARADAAEAKLAALVEAFDVVNGLATYIPRGGGMDPKGTLKRAVLALGAALRAARGEP